MELTSGTDSLTAEVYGATVAGRFTAEGGRGSGKG
jgi:hypothetical protein